MGVEASTRNMLAAMGINVQDQDQEEEDLENMNINTTEMMDGNTTKVTPRPLPYNPYWNEEVNKF